MKFAISIFFLFSLLVLLGGCSSKEGGYKGMYDGMQTANEMTDPGLGSTEYPSHDRQTYQQYKEEREMDVDVQAE